jgi:hypothetical protein
MLDTPNWNRKGMGKKDKSEDWGQISPWLHSSRISSIATFTLLLVFILFPGIKEYITIGDDSLYYAPLIGLWAPFEGTPLTFLIWASSIYCTLGLGLALSKWNGNDPTLDSWSSVISNIFLFLACAVFFFVIPLLSVIWALAFKDWNIAISVWGDWEGNHGPWFRLYHLRRLLIYAYYLSFGSFCFSLLSFIPKPNKLAVILLLSNIVLWFLLVFTHYWLID